MIPRRHPKENVGSAPTPANQLFDRPSSPGLARAQRAAPGCSGGRPEAPIRHVPSDARVATAINAR